MWAGLLIAGWLGVVMWAMPGSRAMAAEEKPADKSASEPKVVDQKVADANVSETAPTEDPTAADEGDPRQEDPAAGHSNHGEVFNEGPRQQAYVMGETGNVHLEVTTQQPLVQQLFDQGVGQLHGFWYFEAERSFRQAAALDPDCAMAYWGMAMANFDNAKRAAGFVKEAVDRKGKASKREQMWIDGLAAYQTGKGEAKVRWRAFIRSLEAIQYEFPEELEAQAFLAWGIWSADRKGLPFSSHLALDSLIQSVLDANPMHPVHHYRIHLWDYEKTERALISASLCGQAAPNIAHMWHMPGHIYWRVKRYHDSAWQQEASARVDHAHMARDRVMPYQIHNYAHNNEWLTRSLAYVGRSNDALALAKNMVELPRHPKQNKLSNRGSGAYYGRLRLVEVLSQFERWEDVLALAESPYLEPTDDETLQLKRLRLLGAAQWSLQKDEAARQTMAAVEEQLTKFRTEQTTAMDDAEKKAKDAKKNEKDIAKAKSDAEKKFTAQIKRWETGLNELRGHEAAREGKYVQALERFAQVSDLPKEQLSQFQLAAGATDKALATAKGAKEAGTNQVLPLANYVHVLHRAGKAEEAQQALEELRAMAADLDVDSRIYQRIAEVAAAHKMEGDWRKPRELPGDTGTRPELASLGPFRWHPSPAPAWDLPGGEGRTVSLAGYRGKPVVVIFYLGYGCLHCAQQLEKFGPLTEQFREAGIELVAISTDSPEKLQNTVAQYKAETDTGTSFPFPLAADENLNVFKAYRAFDDFENLPLHGTFLIDGAGLVRWQDISYEPFMEAEFLLEEAQRLLKQDPPSVPGTTLSGK